MHDHCSGCDERFDRDPRQWFGAVYINLGLTLGLVVTGFVITQNFTSLSISQQLSIWTPTAATRAIGILSTLKGTVDKYHLHL